jgi:uncharacterized membrane protein
VFLAGVGAGLSMTAGRPLRSLSHFLWTRGLWLIIAELTIVRFGWAFNLEYRTQLWVQVIWALGWSMILLAALIHLPRWAIAAFGLALIFGHNLLDSILLHSAGQTLQGASLRDWVWATLHVQRLPIAYPLIPWVGVMAAGYAFAPVFRQPDAQRRRTLLLVGGAATVLFLVLRTTSFYGDPVPWSVQPRPGMTFVSFLSVTKYPPSLLFLLMTLGPAIMSLVLFEWARGAVARFFEIIGRVPFFYYILHIFLLHGLALLVGAAMGIPPNAFFNPPFFGPYGDGWGWGLPVVYAVWILAVLLLYPLCRWFAGVKARRRDLMWLSYL